MSPLAHAQEAYILGAGDKISIKVFGQEDLSIESFLGNSGSVNYPFLGDVKVAGLSIKQVELFITQGLKGDYLINPNVYVQVIEYRPFYIHGEVKKPGGYPYHPGMTINQAVALAGGLTDRADTDKISLYKEADKKLKQHASLQHNVNAGDTITIEQRFF
ncbi:polysaccharide biosynthesis/export family protein [Colwellia sp. TT2012]|uniref:polysaccharide biosynthesis/export family protein n=1 Tax=Colwellia sp. TT2012 TaxID=1720342 RepID=UPI001E4AC665|nr:polysaccharide biosynthesis/export family protein [Colwellia sp. TT2012]